ncbi:hypothetical protein N9B31_03700 [Mariniblastus sp.]|nr:hypothetical protein [Mariniblastus sp.]
MSSKESIVVNMSAEENPPNEMNSTPNNEPIDNEAPREEEFSPSSEDASESDEVIVMAELVNETSVQSEVVVAELAAPDNDNLSPTPAPTGFKTEDMVGRGVAVGSVVLGILCIVGSFFSLYSNVNGILGILMWNYGFLKTNGKPTSYLGLALCLIGLSLSTWLGRIFSITVCLLLAMWLTSTRGQRGTPPVTNNR